MKFPYLDKLPVTSEKEREEFKKKLIQVSADLGISPDWLLLVMWMESRMKPTAVNRLSNATGLIQFMPATAKWLGSSVTEIKSMSAVEQLDLVRRYYWSYKTVLNGFVDLYVATFYPKALLQKWDDSRLFPKAVYSQNMAIDTNGDKMISLGEFKALMLSRVPKGIELNSLKKKAPLVS